MTLRICHECSHPAPHVRLWQVNERGGDQRFGRLDRLGGVDHLDRDLPQPLGVERPLTGPDQVDQLAVGENQAELSVGHVRYGEVLVDQTRAASERDLCSIRKLAQRNRPALFLLQEVRGGLKFGYQLVTQTKL